MLMHECPCERAYNLFANLLFIQLIAVCKLFVIGNLIAFENITANYWFAIFPDKIFKLLDNISIIYYNIYYSKR